MSDVTYGEGYGDFSGAWSCRKCHVRYPKDYEPDYCPTCGHPLARPGDPKWPMASVV